MEEIRKHFPALLGCTYLNTAANGLVPKPVIDWRREHDMDLLLKAGSFRDPHKFHFERIRKVVAETFGSSIDELALIPNFSLGINMVLAGLPEGQRILLLKDDYPSVNWPVETRDYDICYAHIQENLEQNIHEAVVKHKPDIFIFSIVQWLNGVKIDFDFLKELKSYNPNLLLIADGTQYLGTEKFSFKDSPLDVLCASCYKWLTAGYGNGILMIKESARNRIFPKAIGFNSAQSFEDSATETLYMKHYEPGHLDTLNFGSLEKSILFTQSLGENLLHEKVSSLALIAKERFSEMGLLDIKIINRKIHSSIFNLKGDHTIFKKLKENGILTSERGGGIRVSFHYYNTMDDLEKLIEVLK